MTSVRYLLDSLRSWAAGGTALGHKSDHSTVMVLTYELDRRICGVDVWGRPPVEQQLGVKL
jgi:hypothetical protein